MNRGIHAPQQSIKGAPSASRTTRIGIVKRALLVVSIGLFIGAAALGMVSHPEPTSSLPPLRLIQAPLPLTPAQIKVSAKDPAPYIYETRIRAGDTLAAVLQRLHLDAPGLQAFLTHDPSARSIYKLYPGRIVQAATNTQGRLSWLRYIHTPSNETDGSVQTSVLHVTPSGDSYVANEVTENTDQQLRVAEGTIRSSLFAATDAADIPDSITLQIADILSAKIDFLRSLRQGDQFRVIYETRTHEGRTVGSGRVLALEFINGANTYSAVWFSPDDKNGAYYDFEGASLRGAFLRTALKFSRISSTFGMRMHPIHKIWTGHKGVDYAAPSGTPIHATADGVVEFAGWQNGYGNVVIIKHDAKYSTVYAHQSQIDASVKKGVSVNQGQVIGYVGATGWATGPHLHYEFRVDNEPVDPLSVDLPIARTLDASERSAFNQATSSYQHQIRLLTQRQQATPDTPTTLVRR